MLEHGRSTNRGDLLTDGLEIMVGIILSPKRKEKKKQLCFGDSQSMYPETGGGVRTGHFFEGDKGCSD
jgi:hypothetical protein